MSTEKLYDQSAYLTEFEATVLSTVKNEYGTYSVLLDRTAFFPNEGGQKSDRGTLAGVEVVDVRLTGDTITHITKAPLGVGNTVRGKIDFEERFEKMQCHTAEHIVCGLVHKYYGFNNVGFHLSDFDVIFDFDGVLDRDQLDFIEDLANRAVTDNLPVVSYYPTPEELSTLTYRSKLDLSEGVRIVKIGEVDTCACCAPHVSSTGQIGQIRLLEFEKHRGGTRINIAAGYRALRDYRVIYANILKTSALFSEPQATVATAAEAFLTSYEELKSKLKQTRLALARLEAAGIPSTDGSCVGYYPDFTPDELREVVNTAKDKVSGILIALSGNDGDFKLVMSSATVDLSPIAKKILSDLGGRGGGRDNMIQGSATATLDAIRTYFATNTF